MQSLTLDRRELDFLMLGACERMLSIEPRGEIVERLVALLRLFWVDLTPSIRWGIRTKVCNYSIREIEISRGNNDYTPDLRWLPIIEISDPSEEGSEIEISLDDLVAILPHFIAHWQTCRTAWGGLDYSIGRAEVKETFLKWLPLLPADVLKRIAAAMTAPDWAEILERIEAVENYWG